MLVKMRPQYFDNFFLNLYPYVQPSMAHAKRPILLYIMTLGGEVDMPTFNKIKNILYYETRVLKDEQGTFIIEMGQFETEEAAQELVETLTVDFDESFIIEERQENDIPNQIQ
ncbi:hypothetical protein [Fusibacter tunisiensis]|uniref:SPOR domain-containing protein n=1 Tax=Fusibacter tunisiensis TaxID=1008308 RepID=A0ABS2MU86_9FIRM|nr:hypothetical protein [Fusibacter tunisiensis]MBM7562832.1 hypothetical protein [Fusibacter tunisiensis]